VRRTTGRLWLQRYQQRGVAGLKIQWAPGQTGRIPEALAASRYHTTGIAVQRTAMRVFWQRHGIRPYRPAYRSLRGDPEAQRVAREELEA
jgi:transposase